MYLLKLSTLVGPTGGQLREVLLHKVDYSDKLLPSLYTLYISKFLQPDEEVDEVDKEIEGVTGTEEDPDVTPRSEATAKGQSHELIHPNTVMKALRAFVEDNKQPAK